MIVRRKLLGFGLGVIGASMVAPAFAQQEDPIGDLLLRQAGPPPSSPGESVGAMGPVAEPRRVALRNLHTDERLEAVYWEKGAYVPDALAALNTVLRDHRTGDVHPIHPDLFDALDAIAVKTRTRSAFQVISGYRSPASNALLNEHSDEVAKHSLHMDGKAIDIYLEDVALDRLRAVALDLGRGGVGYYPQTRFVHVDVGPVRRWRGA